jgi:AraC family transcriptional regulator, arabinose operon regulatory protein
MGARTSMLLLETFRFLLMPILSAGLDVHPGPYQFSRAGTFPSWVIAFQARNELRLFARDREASLKGGQLLLIQPRTAYRLEASSAQAARRQIWAIFSPRQEWLRLLRWPEAVPGIALVTVAGTAVEGEIIAACEEIARAWQSTLPERIGLAENALERLLLHVQMIIGDSPWSQLNDSVRLALDHISAHSSESIDLARLARAAHCSPSHLSHIFREQVGDPPMRYLERQRIERAKHLLLSTNLAIRSIATAVGFDNAFHFSTRFRAVTGRSPKQWRTKPATNPHS